MRSDGVDWRDRAGEWMRPDSRVSGEPALDGLRGLAVLIVLASHLSNYGLLPAPGLQGTGKSGVYLFFVLSAFLLVNRLLVQGPAAMARASTWIDYALRRILRIAPLYLLVLLLSAALTAAGVQAWHYQMDLPALGRHLLLREGQSVLWSIPVELKFYLLIPPLVLLLHALAGARHRFVLGLLALAGLIALAVVVWPPSSAVANDASLGPYLAVFLSGAAAAWVHGRLGLSTTVRAWGTSAWGVVAGMVTLALVASIPSVTSMLTGQPFDPARSHRWFLFYGLVWSLLLLAVLHGPQTLRRAFSAPALRWAGAVSFSAYLWHMPVLEAVVRMRWPAPVALVVVVLVVALVSTISYRVIERPLQGVRWKSA